jgi:hypothetical protein
MEWMSPGILQAKCAPGNCRCLALAKVVTLSLSSPNESAINGLLSIYDIFEFKAVPCRHLHWCGLEDDALSLPCFSRGADPAGQNPATTKRCQSRR